METGKLGDAAKPLGEGSLHHKPPKVRKCRLDVKVTKDREN